MAINRFFLSALVLAATLAPANSRADDDLSPTGKRIFFNASLCFKELARDNALFDGTRLGEGKQMNAFEFYHRRMVENIACVQARMASLPDVDKRHPDYKRYINHADSLVDYVNAMGIAIEARKNGQKAADDQCRAFQTETSSHGTEMRYWVQVDRSSGFFGDEAGAKTHLAAIDAVGAVCSKKEFADVGKVGCDWLKVGDGQHSPAYWCELAARKKELGLKTLRDYAEFRLQHIIGVRAEDVASRDGWLPIEGPVELARLEESGSTQFAQVFGPMRAVAALMGDAGYFEKPELLAPYLERFEKVKDAVRAAASSWKLPAKEGNSYGVKLGKKAIASWHRKAKIVRAFQSDATWKVYRNALTSVPESRQLSGYVLFRLPGAELCQLRPWTLTETYRGGGRYQKAKGVAIGYVRWQKCE